MSEYNRENIGMSEKVLDCEEMTRANIESLGSQVKITDTDEESGLELFCYSHCNSDNKEILQRCRGVVFHKDTMVMSAFPYTIEILDSNQEEINRRVGGIFENCSVYDAHEGMLIRVFNFQGRWFTSTNRKLNAFRSKWSSQESFGDMFKKALVSEAVYNVPFRLLLNNNPDYVPNPDTILDNFYSTLDVTKQYMFLVRYNSENRIVCSVPDRPTVYHVGTFVDKKLSMDENIGIPTTKKHTFASIEDMVDHVKNINIRFLQGVIVFTPDNRQYKIMNSNYMKLFDVRGNEPVIKYRYLQIRRDYNSVNILFALYPDMIKVCQEYENILYDVAKKIHYSYIQRHIHGQWSELPYEEYEVSKACHSWHLEDRTCNKVTFEKVIEVLNQQSATNLNKMIRHFINEMHDKKEIQLKVMNSHRAETVNSSNSPKIDTIATSPFVLSRNTPDDLFETNNEFVLSGE